MFLRFLRWWCGSGRIASRPYPEADRIFIEDDLRLAEAMEAAVAALRRPSGTWQPLLDERYRRVRSIASGLRQSRQWDSDEGDFCLTLYQRSGIADLIEATVNDAETNLTMRNAWEKRAYEAEAALIEAERLSVRAAAPSEDVEIEKAKERMRIYLRRLDRE